MNTNTIDLRMCLAHFLEGKLLYWERPSREYKTFIDAYVRLADEESFKFMADLFNVDGVKVWARVTVFFDTEELVIEYKYGTYTLNALDYIDGDAFSESKIVDEIVRTARSNSEIRDLIHKHAFAQKAIKTVEALRLSVSPTYEEFGFEPQYNEATDTMHVSVMIASYQGQSFTGVEVDRDGNVYHINPYGTPTDSDDKRLAEHGVIFLTKEELNRLHDTH